MKILYFGSSPAPYQLDFWKELNKFHSIEQIYLLKKIPIHSWEFSDDNSISFIDYDYLKFRWRNIKAILRLPKIIFNKQFDLIIIGGYHLPYLITFFAAFIKRKKIFLWLERPFEASRITSIVKRYYFKFLAFFATGVLCVGKLAHQYYSQFFCNNFNLPYSIHVNKKNLSIRNDLDILNFLFIGQLIERKGIPLILDAFKRIPDKNIRLLIGGIGTYESHVQLASRHDRRIEYLGYLNQEGKDKVLDESDVLLMPSIYDGWGVVLAEGTSRGLFSVVTKTVGAMHDICDYNDHIPVELNIKSIENAMYSCIHNKDRIFNSKSSIIEIFLKTRANSLNAAHDLAEFFREYL